MPRRLSPLEANFPVPGDFVVLATRWRSDAIDILLDFIWKGLDRLRARGYTFALDQENPEREISQFLAPEIRDGMSGEEPYYLEHGPFESETRKTAKAQPPQYDLGFVLWENRRAIWPIEAKVLKTENAISEYVKSIQTSFLTANYAPFSSEAAMLGYLLQGSPAVTLAQIAKALACSLESHPRFLERDHRLSRHKRTIPPGKPYQSEFTCHHIIALMINKTSYHC